MASLRDIRQKIGTVKNINKITQAMKMVAAAKLRKSQERVQAAGPFARKMREVLAAVLPQVPDSLVATQPVLQTREATGRIGVIVISSDRGLCGSYNNNIIRRAQEFMNARRAEGTTVELVTIGRKCTTSLRNRGWQAVQSFNMIGVDAPFAEVKVITETVTGLYTRRENPVDEVWVAYTEFINAVLQRPTVERFLPLAAESVQSAAAEGAGAAEAVEYEFDPDAESLLAELLPRMVDNQVYQYLLEATASEYGARMTAMSKASDNAGEMIGTLTLQYNRVRQDAITKELLDIVGGASALQSQ